MTAAALASKMFVISEYFSQNRSGGQLFVKISYNIIHGKVTAAEDFELNRLSVSLPVMFTTNTATKQEKLLLNAFSENTTIYDHSEVELTTL